MNQKNLLDQIKDYLTTFQLQVKISSKNNEYDINIHSENVIIPILNILYKADLKNLNESTKNADTVDLMDTNKRLAFQITSTGTLEKVKSTLTKLMKSNYYGKFDKLYIYILTERQKSYSQPPLNKIVGKKFGFDAKTDILDATDLYRKIQALTDIEVIKEIKEILRKQFSELYLTESYTRTDLKKFRDSYKKSCLTNFSRLNFFGISVSRKPREVELYRLFVEAKIKHKRKWILIL